MYKCQIHILRYESFQFTVALTNHSVYKPSLYDKSSMISVRSINPGEVLMNVKNKIMFESLVHLQEFEYYSRNFYRVYVATSLMRWKKNTEECIHRFLQLFQTQKNRQYMSHQTHLHDRSWLEQRRGRRVENPLIVFVDMNYQSLIVPFDFLKRKNKFPRQNHYCSLITEDLCCCGNNSIITVTFFMLVKTFSLKYIFCIGYICRIYTSVLYLRHFLYILFLYFKVLPDV
jgi:hypothetical protein